MTDNLPVKPSRVLAQIDTEIADLALIKTVAGAADADRRAGAIQEMTKRSKLEIPIQNRAAVLAARAKELLADLVDAAQAAGEIATKGQPKSNVPPGDIKPKRLKDIDENLTRQTVEKARKARDAHLADKLEEQAEQEPSKPVSAKAVLKDEQKAAAKKARDADRAKARRTAKRPFQDRCQLYHGDLLEAGAAIADRSIDAIVTDPPYPAEYLPEWDKLGELAGRVLKPGGWMVIMAAHAHLPEILRRLERDELTYRWTLAYLMPTGESAQHRALRLNIKWKPILLYTAGTMNQITSFGSDVLENAVQDVDRHEQGWGQGVDGFRKLVAGVTRADELVLDPFLGTGTTAVAAITQGRRFAGIDVDEAYIADTWHRLETEAGS